MAGGGIILIGKVDLEMQGDGPGRISFYSCIVERRIIRKEIISSIISIFIHLSQLLDRKVHR